MTLAKRNKFNVCNATEKPRFQRASMAIDASTATARLNPRKPRKQSCGLAKKMTQRMKRDKSNVCNVTT
jgi:hypothetical protein